MLAVPDKLIVQPHQLSLRSFSNELAVPRIEGDVIIIIISVARLVG